MEPVAAPAANLELAFARYQQGDAPGALALCGELLRREPRDIGALRLGALAALALGDAPRSLELLDRALRLEPGHAPTHFNRGVTLDGLGQADSALGAYSRAVALRPGYVAALYNRGNVLRKLGRLRDAIADYDVVLAAEPGHASADVNRANALRDLGCAADALAGYERALARAEGDPEVHCNRGVAFYDLNRPAEAIDCFNRAIALRPQYAAAYQNRAYAHLLAGNYAQGWADHEWRWRNAALALARTQRTHAKPLWLGEESLRDRRIVLHAEQGFGDTLQFCRYAPLVAARGGHVILDVPYPLAPLLSGLEGVAQVVTSAEPLPPHDYHCPLMSLPFAFRTGLGNIPARIPYLRSDPLRSAAWRQRLGTRAGLRVGLAWSGGFRPDQPEVWHVNRRRNIPLVELAPLRHPDIEFYSLQKGEPAVSELAELVERGWNGPALRDFTPELGDFADTAALIDQLDLVVTVDTSVAHLAGALGKRVWIMNRLDTCWRWLLDRADSPWYPTARLYRQARAGDWTDVVRRVRADLETVLEAC